MKIDLDKAIRVLVEALLPRFSGDKILQIGVESTYSHYTETKTKEKKTFIIFLFQREGNYTKVLMEERNKPFMMYDVNEWYLTSDHDSCWDSDGVGSQLRKIDQKYSAMFKDANFYQHVHFSIVSPKVFDGTMKRTKDDYNCRTFTVEIHK